MRFSAIATSLCILCSIPQEGLCLPQNMQDELLQHVIMNDSDDWLEQIDRFTDLIEKSENPKGESRQLFQSLIDSINARYEEKFTLAESCQMVRNKIGIFPSKIRKHLKSALSDLSQPASYRVAFSNGPMDRYWAAIIMLAILSAVVLIVALLNPLIAGVIITALTRTATNFVKEIH